MKILSYIGIILVMVLSFVPCSDAIASVHANQKVHISKTTTDQHQETSKDLCSPFCHCSCCSTPSLILYVQTKAPLFPVDCKIYMLQITGRFLNVILPVWQPPQLG